MSLRLSLEDIVKEKKKEGKFKKKNKKPFFCHSEELNDSTQNLEGQNIFFIYLLTYL